MLTVIIATLNRSKAINEISLPSLLKQDTADFEVLIWDASEDDLTEKVAESYQNAFIERGVGLRYVRAPRKGLASQRNDSVKEANGDIVFFIDDDSEVSPSGVAAVITAFGENERLYGAGLPIDLKSVPSTIAGKRTLFTRFLSMAKQLLFVRGTVGRRVKKSTINVLYSDDAPGTAEWLGGCGMAYKKTVFDELHFDERLERFGGYALGEDADFSHRVLLHYKEPLLIVPGGQVAHHAVPGGRLDRIRFNAAFFYNTRIIRDNFNKYNDYGLVSFLFGQRILRVFRMIEHGSTISEIIAGYKAYRKAIREDAFTQSHSFYNTRGDY